MLAALIIAAACAAGGTWPAEDWASRAVETAASRPAAIRALEDYAFTVTGPEDERKGVRTNAVLIVHQGAVIYERYARGFDKTVPHLTWSVSKTAANAVTGAAVHKGLLATTDSICKHRPDLRKESCPITLDHLLDFSSGLAWKESYEGESNQASSVLAMLYGEGHGDMAAFVAGHDVRDPPGATFMYSSGDTTLLTGAIGAALRPSLGEDFAWTLLFDPLGMKSAAWEKDAKGTLVGSSYLFATARDLARLGYLFLHDGCWNGARILPDGWVRASTSVSEAFKKRPLGADPDDVQGRQIWLNRPVPEQNVTTPWPHVPEDAYAARGHWGQSMTVVPSRELIVVRYGDDREKKIFDFDRFLSLALAVGE